MEHGQLLGHVDRELERLVGIAGGVSRAVLKRKCLYEQPLGLGEHLLQPIHPREVEKVPVLALLDDLHQPGAGELEIQVIGLLAMLQASGLKVKPAQRADIPHQANRHCVLVSAIRDQQPVAEDDVTGNRDTLRPQHHRRKWCKTLDLLPIFVALRT